LHDWLDVEFNWSWKNVVGMEPFEEITKSCRRRSFMNREVGGQRGGFYTTWIKERRAKQGSKGSKGTVKRGVEELVERTSDEFTFCRTLIRDQLYRAGVCLHTMNRAFSIDVAGRLTPICCTFCSLLGFSGPPLNKYGLRVLAHHDVREYLRCISGDNTDTIIIHWI